LIVPSLSLPRIVPFGARLCWMGWFLIGLTGSSLLRGSEVDSLYRAIRLQTQAQQWQGLCESHETLALWFRDRYRYDSALHHMQAAARWAQQAGDQIARVKLINEVGRLYFWLDDYPAAIEVLRQANELAVQVAPVKLQAKNLAYLTEVYIALGNYQQAMSQQLKGLDLSTRLGDSAGMALAYHQLGSIYWYREQYEPARAHLVKALKLYPSVGYAINRYTIKASLASIFTQQNHLGEAATYAQQSLDLAKEIDYAYGVAFSIGMLGTIAQRQQRYPEAEAKVRAAIAQMKAMNIKAEVIDYEVVLANVLIEQKRADEALPLLHQTLKLADSVGSKRYLSETYKTLAQVHEALGNTDSAFFFFKQHSQYRDSLLNEKSLEQMANLETEYQLQEQQRRIAVLEAQQQQQQNRLRLYGVGGLVLLLGLWLWWLYRRYFAQKQQVSQLERQQRKLAEEAEQLTRQQTTLQQIARDLHLPLSALRAQEQTKPHSDSSSLKDVIQQMEQRLAMLSVFAVGEAQSPPVEVDLGALVPEVIAGLPDDLRRHATRIHLNQLGMVCGQRGQLALLFHHLISNAIRFRSDDEPLIHIAATPQAPQPGRCLITIKDNGRGISPRRTTALMNYLSRGEGDSPGVGLALARQVVHMHQGQIWLDSEVEAGTTVYFHLPTQNSC